MLRKLHAVRWQRNGRVVNECGLQLIVDNHIQSAGNILLDLGAQLIHCHVKMFLCFQTLLPEALHRLSFIRKVVFMLK